MTLEEKARQMDMYSTAQVLLNGEFSEAKIQQVTGESGLGAIQGSYASTEAVKKIQNSSGKKHILAYPYYVLMRDFTVSFVPTAQSSPRQFPWQVPGISNLLKMKVKPMQPK